MPDQYVTLAEMQELTGVSVEAIRRYRNAGLVTAFRVPSLGSNIYLWRDDAEVILECKRTLEAERTKKSADTRRGRTLLYTEVRFKVSDRLRQELKRFPRGYAQAAIRWAVEHDVDFGGGMAPKPEEAKPRPKQSEERQPLPQRLKDVRKDYAGKRKPKKRKNK